MIVLSAWIISAAFRLRNLRWHYSISIVWEEIKENNSQDTMRLTEKGRKGPGCLCRSQRLWGPTVYKAAIKLDEVPPTEDPSTSTSAVLSHQCAPPCQRHTHIFMVLKISLTKHKHIQKWVISPRVQEMPQENHISRFTGHSQVWMFESKRRIKGLVWSSSLMHWNGWTEQEKQCTDTRKEMK